MRWIVQKRVKLFFFVPFILFHFLKLYFFMRFPFSSHSIHLHKQFVVNYVWKTEGENEKCKKNCFAIIFRFIFVFLFLVLSGKLQIYKRKSHENEISQFIAFLGLAFVLKNVFWWISILIFLVTNFLFSFFITKKERFLCWGQNLWRIEQTTWCDLIWWWWWW